MYSNLQFCYRCYGAAQKMPAQPLPNVLALMRSWAQTTRPAHAEHICADVVLRLRCHRQSRLRLCSHHFRSSRLKLLVPSGLLSQPPTLALLHRYAGKQLQAHFCSRIKLQEIPMLV